ncbi:heterokaryon incompatibility protein-domain-containing protein [Nemania abortiva]|nr:heterokaryon incompatibility protein-domain-containing protein [Nemania abortiva]
MGVVKTSGSARARTRLQQRRPKCQVCEKILLVIRQPSNGETLGTARQILHNSSCLHHRHIISDYLQNHLKCAKSDHDHKIDIIRWRKGLARFYSRCASTGELSVSLLPLQMLLDRGTSARGRAVNSKWIDPCLLKQWRRTCDREHGKLCHPPPLANFAQQTPELLIDVWQQCLVPALPSTDYICLSYVWGGSAQFSTLSSNVEKLRQPGALAPANMTQPLSNTIRHAMAVVEMLEGRYLWVDALCIVQDNAGQRHQEIDKMGAIYANAMLTIVAEGGSNADSCLFGLRGVSPSRTFDQRTWSLGRGIKVAEMPEVTENSIWGERGWTFQEEILSKRRLILSKNSVRWMCQCAHWREDVNPSDTSATLEGVDVAPVLGNTTMGYSLLTSLIEKYNTRTFTFPEDSLDAFTGITTALRPQLSILLSRAFPWKCSTSLCFGSRLNNHSPEGFRRAQQHVSQAGAGHLGKASWICRHGKPGVATIWASTRSCGSRYDRRSHGDITSRWGTPVFPCRQFYTNWRGVL